jgi:hypothetical protein
MIRSFCGELFPSHAGEQDAYPPPRLRGMEVHCGFLKRVGEMLGVVWVSECGIGATLFRDL